MVLKRFVNYLSTKSFLLWSHLRSQSMGLGIYAQESKHFHVEATTLQEF